MVPINPPPTPVPDSVEFYSSVAQISSAFVGFLGGFFILRLQTYSQEWRDLRLEIERLTAVIEATQAASRRLQREAPGSLVPTVLPHAPSSALEQSTMAQVEQLQRREVDALRELRPLLHRRSHAIFPLELTLMAVLLLLLLVGGVGAPLLELPDPAIGEKIVYLVVVGGLFLALGTSMLVLALISWNRLRKPLPSAGADSLEAFLNDENGEPDFHF